MSAGIEHKCEDCGQYFYVPIEIDMADCPHCIIKSLEAERELALINFMDRVRHDIATLRVQAESGRNDRDALKGVMLRLSEDLDYELRLMSMAHCGVMDMRRRVNCEDA